MVVCAPQCSTSRRVGGGPGPRTSVQGLYIAGAWTDTGWPATMEGAVRSGYLAAESLLLRAGRTEKIVQPDLA